MNGKESLDEPRSTTDPSPDEPPPLLGSWPRWYAAVVAFLALLILLFYWFEKAFTPS